MSFNANQQEIDDAAIRDTKEKIELEAIIGGQLLRKYFSPISSAFFLSYSQNGVIPPLDQHHQQLNNILNSNYSKTAKQFSRQIRDALGRLANAATINDNILFGLELKQRIDVFFSQDSISSTTENDLSRAVRDILLAAAVAGITLTDQQVARQAQTKFDSLSRARVDTISMTQTEQAAEGAKHTEAGVLQKDNAVFPSADVDFATATVRKTWVTVMDNRVRPAHVLAEGQRVPLTQPFTVGGELLMHPGDSSLGATLGNIINCRCSSVITIR
jgi:hypothetical protein